MLFLHFWRRLFLLIWLYTILWILRLCFDNLISWFLRTLVCFKNIGTLFLRNWHLILIIARFQFHLRDLLGCHLVLKTFICLFDHYILNIMQYRVEALECFLLEFLVHLRCAAVVLIVTATVMTLQQIQQSQFPANPALKDVNFYWLVFLLELVESVDHRFLLFLNLGRLWFFNTRW